MYLDDYEVGMEFSTDGVRINREEMIEFARRYDPFPLHYDDEYAKHTRFGKMIAPGVLSFMAVWARVMELGFLGEEQIAGKSTKIDWFRPVYADDVLTGKGKVTRIERRNAHNGIAELTLWVYNQDGELVLTNITEAIIQYRP
jgi:3-hydroxybutyryl-CoA dehydratase